MFATPSLRNAYALRYPEMAHRFVVITNGYDAEELPIAVTNNAGTFRVVYSGSLYGDHELEIFVEGVRRLLDRRDDVVEGRPALNAAVGELLRERAVAPVEASGLALQRAIRVGVLFEDASHDEASHAKAVAQHLGTAHTELYVSGQDAIDVIPRLGEVYCEPFGDSSQIPTVLQIIPPVFEAAAEGAPSASGPLLLPRLSGRAPLVPRRPHIFLSSISLRESE